MLKKSTEAAPATGIPAPKRKRDGNGRRKTVPKIPAYPPFEFLASPDRWTIHASGRVVPELRQLKQIGGVQGAVREEDGSIDVEGALTNARRVGYVELPEDLGGEPYALGYQVANGISYLPKWLRPIPGSQVLRHDVELELEFLDQVVEHLTDAGLIDGGPSIDVLEALVAAAEARVDAALDKEARKPGHKRTRLILEKQAEAARHARDTRLEELEQQGSPEAEPAPKAKKGKAAEDDPK